jgi:uncharacterized protein YukE
VNPTADDKERLAREFTGWKQLVTQLLQSKAMTSTLRVGSQAESGGGQVWSGPAADRFIEQLLRLKADLDRLPDGFARTARNLQNSAHDLRAKEHK